MNDRDMILKEIQRFVEAYRASDIEGVMDSYTEDVVKMRNGAQTEDREHLKERLTEFFKKWRGNVTVDNHEILISNDLAVIRGAFEVQMNPIGAGESQLIKRRFVEVWRKQHGRWRVARTMDNVEQ